MAREIKKFQQKVWDYYASYGRHALPWRKTKNPYKILVSEIMLQQTQVDRVLPKYTAFLKRFPTPAMLAASSMVDVLLLWSGLGYNRRALFLKRAAETIMRDFGGRFPRDAAALRTLPGVGPYTAGAVAAFAYNQLGTLIETNIRAVFLHEFFPDGKAVFDADLMPLIEKALPKDGRFREWYWALMDYGAYLKKAFPNPSMRSKHHVKQSKFEGSLRQVRGVFLKVVTEKKKIAKENLFAAFPQMNSPVMEKALGGLVVDGFVRITKKGTVVIGK